MKNNLLTKIPRSVMWYIFLFLADVAIGFIATLELLTRFTYINMHCMICVNYIHWVKSEYFVSKFIFLLQLTNSYFCSVIGYDLLHSFTVLHAN